jgi:type I restriction enzyme R subunit
MTNQNPEQVARDHIDKQLSASGWVIQSIKKINLNAGVGVAVKEYLTDVGPADYVLFVEGKPKEIPPIEYDSKMQLDKDVVNPNQIRTIIKTFKEKLPTIFKDRYDKDGNFEVPKTLIFAKTDSRPLEKKPGVVLKDLLQAIAVGAREEELFTTLASRLIRLEKQLTEKEKQKFKEKANGKTIPQVAKELLNAFNPDIIENVELKIKDEKLDASPEEIELAVNKEMEKIQNEAAKVFTGELNEFIENVRKTHEQRIDTNNPDEVINAGWDKDNKDKANELVTDFTIWMQEHKDELTALQIFYNEPFRRRELTYSMLKEVLETLLREKPVLAPVHVWQAYEALGQCKGSPLNELTALVSLIKKVSGLDSSITAYDKIVDKNFQDWVFKKQAGATKFNEEQMVWLRMIKEYVVNSFHIEKEDFDLDPFNRNGGLGKFYQLFKDDYEKILDELNEVLAA